MAAGRGRSRTRRRRSPPGRRAARRRGVAGRPGRTPGSRSRGAARRRARRLPRRRRTSRSRRSAGRERSSPRRTPAARSSGRGWLRERRRLDAPGDAAVDERDPEQVPRDPQCEARPGTHPRAALVAPADRHDRELVAALAGQEDQLDVEDDAQDLLPCEQVLGRDARESLEPALGVLAPGRRPTPTRANGTPCRAFAGTTAGTCACPSRRAGSGCRGRRRSSPGPR